MRYLALSFTLCFLTPQVSGQTALPLQLGQRVWIRSPTASGLDAGVRGTIEEVSGDFVTLRTTPRASPLSVAIGPRTRVYVFKGRRSSTLQGAALGGGGGVLAGALVGYVTGEDCSPDQFLCFGREIYALGGALLGGLVGVVGGAIIGASSSHETWARIGSSGATRPIVSPSRGGVSLGLALAF